MRRNSSIFGLFGLVLLLCAGPGLAQFARVPPASAAGSYPSDPVAQPPINSQNGGENGTDERYGAARISILQGDVNVRRGDTSELVAAFPNAPLIAQDRLQTSTGSRAEIQLDSAHMLRLAPDTDVAIANLEYHHFQLQLGAGTVLYRVLRSSDSGGEVETPSVALRAVEQGAYRIAVGEDGTTRIDVRLGAAEILGPRGSERIEAGHSVLVRGNPADPEFQETTPALPDQLDDWSDSRDRELLSSQSYAYVSPDVSGAEDLDANGSWVPSQYGQVWAPRDVSADWSPYSNGQWNWEPHYGWTWVDYAPWGWAPYHYGRWLWNGNHGWCWWPGPRLSAHVWKPALVGFFGWNNGAIGWTALAPYEALRPWWGSRASDPYRAYGPGGPSRFYNAVVGSTYRNAGYRGGAIYASSAEFGGPHQRFGLVTREQIGSANFIAGSVPAQRGRTSYWFANRPATPNGRFVMNPQRQFFQSRRPGLYRTEQPNGNTYVRRSPPNGWQRFGDPGTGTSYRQGSGGNGESGWHQFGRPQQIRPNGNAVPTYRRPDRMEAERRYDGSGRRYGGNSGNGSNRRFSSGGESSRRRDR